MTCQVCGEGAKYERVSANQVLSRLGQLRVEHAVYQCQAEVCKVRTKPRRAELSLPTASLTQGAEHAIGMVAANVSFTQAAHLLHDLTAIPVNAKRVERVAKCLGAKLHADEQRQVMRAAPFVEAPSDCGAIDGTGIPMRPEATADRVGKGADGVAKTREVKVVAFWRTDDDQVKPHYDAAIESAATSAGESPFDQRLARQGERTGFTTASQQTMLSDGAVWIEQLVSRQFPKACKILDFYHVSSHIYQACEAHYGSDVKRAQAKHQELKGKLRAGNSQAVINALRQFGAPDEVAYLMKNQARMDYPRYRERGLPISSARIENACKNVIGTRFKQGGMRWSLAGATKMLALRCRYMNHELDAWYERQRDAHRVQATPSKTNGYAWA